MNPSRYPNPLPFPEMWLSSSTEIVAAGPEHIPARGKKFRLTVNDVYDLQRFVLRSDAANFSIPEYKLEHPSGDTVFNTLIDMIRDMRIGMERGLSLAGKDELAEAQRSLRQLDDCLHVERAFVVVIDDPLGVSYIGPRLHGSNVDTLLEVVNYERTPQQQEELGILPNPKVELDGGKTAGATATAAAAATAPAADMKQTSGTAAASPTPIASASAATASSTGGSTSGGASKPAATSYQRKTLAELPDDPEPKDLASPFNRGWNEADKPSTVGPVSSTDPIVQSQTKRWEAVNNMLYQPRTGIDEMVWSSLGESNPDATAEQRAVMDRHTPRRRYPVLLRYHRPISPQLTDEKPKPAPGLMSRIGDALKSVVSAAPATPPAAKYVVEERWTYLDDRHVLHADHVISMFALEAGAMISLTDSSGEILTGKAAAAAKKNGNGVTGVVHSVKHLPAPDTFCFEPPAPAPASATAATGTAAASPDSKSVPTAATATATVAAATAAAVATPIASSADSKVAAVAGGDLPVPAHLTIDFTAPPQIEHEWVRCDACSVSPLKHWRYKCDPVGGCKDFDLCERCYSTLYDRATGKPLTLKSGDEKSVSPAVAAMNRGAEDAKSKSGSDAAATTTESTSAPVPHKFAHLANKPYIKTHNLLDAGHRMVRINRVEQPPRMLPGATQLDGFLNICSNYAPMPCVGARKRTRGGGFGAYEWLSYADFMRRFLWLGSGLRRFTRPRTYVGILALNRIEWLITDYACVTHSFVSIPIHTTYTPEAMKFIIDTTELQVLIVSMEQVTQSRAHVQSLVAECKTVQHVVLIGTRDGGEDDESRALTAKMIASLKVARPAVTVHVFETVEENGRAKTYPPTHSLPTDITTVVFTSGSTGMPKGVIFTESLQHNDLIHAAHHRLSAGAHPVELEFLPFAWATGREDFRGCCLLGGAFAIFERPMQYLLEEFQSVRPTSVQGVPSIFNVVYAEAVRLLRIKQAEIALEAKRASEKKNAATDSGSDNDAGDAGGDREELDVVALATNNAFWMDAIEVSAKTVAAGPSAVGRPAAKQPKPKSKSKSKPKPAAAGGDIPPPPSAPPPPDADGEMDAATAAVAIKRIKERHAVEEAKSDFTHTYANDRVRTHEQLHGKVTAAHTEEEYGLMRELASHLFGDRASEIVTGGALTSPLILEFLKRVFRHCRLYDAYGTTEVGGISTDYRLHQTGIQLKLMDVPEMGYFTTDQPFPRGEVCVKSRRMTPGYFKNREATEKQFIDGWFHTGDIGVRRGDEIYVIDRKSALLKLSHGEFISPEMLEGVYGASQWVSGEGLFVYGELDKTGLIAVAVVNIAALITWAKSSVDKQLAELAGRVRVRAATGMLTSTARDGDKKMQAKTAESTDTNDDPATAQFLLHPTVHQLVLADFASLATARKLPATQIPQFLLLTTTPFTAENGMLTPSMKICRPKIRQTYLKQLKSIYASQDPTAVKMNSLVQALIQEMQRSTGATAADTKSDAKSDTKSAAAGADAASAAIVDLSLSLSQLGVTSVETIRLISAVRDQLHVELPLDLAFQPTFSLRDLARYLALHSPVGASTAASTAVAESPAVIEQRAQRSQFALFDEDLKRDWSADAVAGAEVATGAVVPSNRVFVTGVTGFLGLYLLDTLLKQRPAAAKAAPSAPPQPVYVCLIRAASDDQARERLIAAMTAHGLAYQTYSHRILAVAGSLEQPRFGLSPAAYKSLCGGGFDAIYHCAAWVNWILPYSTLRASNVLGTFEILRLAITTRCPAVHHISTLSVARNSSASEDEWRVPSVGAGAASMPNRDGYTLSKWMSEYILRAYAQKHPFSSGGFVLSVYRPGTITGHSVTGFSHETDFFPRYLKSCIELSCTVQSGGCFELLPVDVTSHAIVRVSLARERDAAAAATATQCFHVANSAANLVSYSVLGELIVHAIASFAADEKSKAVAVTAATAVATAAARPAVSALPFVRWYSTFTANKHNSLFALDAFVSDERFWSSKAPEYDCVNTLRVLKADAAKATDSKPFTLTTINQSLITVYLHRLLRGTAPAATATTATPKPTN